MNNAFATPKISIAPMVDRTDRHFRYFCRLFTKHALLYTEMTTAPAILHGNTKKLLDFDPIEKPLALQVAGSNPQEIFEAVKIAEDWDYDEINLNVGCPSDRVSGNEMGAILMAYPERVAELVGAMKRATKKPVTVKNRIGIDGTHILPSTFKNPCLDGYDTLKNFIEIVSQAGASNFIIHARIAILAGLSPKENREVPPLRYEEVYRIKQDFPHLGFVINGGISTVDAINTHLSHTDGVMIGRCAYENPAFLVHADAFTHNTHIQQKSRAEIIEGYIPYVESQESQGVATNAILRHILGLFYGKKGSSAWKQLLSPPYSLHESGYSLLKKSLSLLPSDVLSEKIA